MSSGLLALVCPPLLVGLGPSSRCSAAWARPELSAGRRQRGSASEGRQARAAATARLSGSSSSSSRSAGSPARGSRAGASTSSGAAAFTSSSSSGTSGSAVPPPNAIKVYEAGRQGDSKRIVAETVVQAPVDVVWRVLTNYERLADFVPNLEACERLPAARPGVVCLRQRGCSQGVLWRLEAEAVMEVEEVRGPLGRREARFTMLEGDFKEMSGRWVVEPDPNSAVGMATLVRFDISVQPKQPLPSAIVSYVVRAGLPANIQAVARRSEVIAANRLKVSGLARWVGTEDDPPIPPQPGDSNPAGSALLPPWEQEAAEEEAARAVAAAVDEASSQQQLVWRDDRLPSKGPFWRLTGSTFPEAAPLTAARQRQAQGLLPEEEAEDEDEDEQDEDEQQQLGGEEGLGGSSAMRPLQRSQQAAAAAQPSSYLGIVSVPLPPAGNRAGAAPQTQQELNQRQEVKERLQTSYPAFGLRRASSRSGSGTPPPTPSPVSTRQAQAAAAAAEVHLRRLDTFDTLHRRAVAAITIDAPPEAVWAVLTDYGRLAEFIPNLAVSQRIALPPTAPPNIIRIRQVGYKRMLYMCLHAESVLDLIEKPQSEIQFRQVAGDFERFQGKWMLQGVGGPGASNGSSSSSSSDAEGSVPGATHTQLKYAVEIVIPRATRMLGVLEPLLERTVFEDVPANLAAIKARVEAIQAECDIRALEAAGETTAAANLRRKLERPTLADMAEDFGVLVAELERCFGEERLLPSRSELREMNRTDLEKAISAHGGKTKVAAALGWRQRTKVRRPKGYWDSLDNVRAELDEFIEEQGAPQGVMPPKADFVRAGRYDIARAVERWGGLYELAQELGYTVADSRKPGSSEWQEHISEVAATTKLSGRQGLFELAAKTYAAKRSMQGSIDGGDEFALADILAAADAGAGLGFKVSAATNGSSANGSSANGSGTDGTGAKGSGASPPAASSSKNGSAKSGSNKAKSSKHAAVPAVSRGDRSFRSEIDEW